MCTDTAEAVNKLLGEKMAGKLAGGSVDLVGINGENFFHRARQWLQGFAWLL